MSRLELVQKINTVFGRHFNEQKGLTHNQVKEFLHRTSSVMFLDEELIEDLMGRNILTKDMVTHTLNQIRKGIYFLNTLSRENVIESYRFETRRRLHAWISAANHKGGFNMGEGFIRRVPKDWNNPIAIENREAGVFMLKDPWVAKVKQHLGEEGYQQWFEQASKIEKTGRIVKGLDSYNHWLKSKSNKNKPSVFSIGDKVILDFLNAGKLINCKVTSIETIRKEDKENVIYNIITEVKPDLFYALKGISSAFVKLDL